MSFRPPSRLKLAAEGPPERASEIENREPDGVPNVVPQRTSRLPRVAPRYGPVALHIRLQPLRREHFRGIGDGAKMPPTTRKLRVAAGFLSLPDSGLPLGMVGVIVILVYGHHHARRIDDWLPRIQRFPHQPVIPEDAQHKRRYLRPIQSARKREVIDPFSGASLAPA